MQNRIADHVARFVIGSGSITDLPDLVQNEYGFELGKVVLLVDQFFEANKHILTSRLPLDRLLVFYIKTDSELKTDYVNEVTQQVLAASAGLPDCIVAVGGGKTLDIGKAVSNLCTNGGQAADFQGWDLVKKPGVTKIAIPTLSGTGAEASRTCVMTNSKTGLKLGMNSMFSVYDFVLMDPSLTVSVPRDQYFFSGMDTFIHSIEQLAGHHRNAVGDAYSREAVRLCHEIFLDGDMCNEDSRMKMMTASFLGGSAIATGFVGLVHPLSAGLSVVFDTPHCLANCMVMRAMEDFYPEECRVFFEMVSKQGVEIPRGIGANLSDDKYQALYDASVCHEKPLENALGADFKDILSTEFVRSLFKRM